MIKFFFEHGRGGRGCYGQGLCQKKMGSPVFLADVCKREDRVSLCGNVLSKKLELMASKLYYSTNGNFNNYNYKHTDCSILRA